MPDTSLPSDTIHDSIAIFLDNMDALWPGSDPATIEALRAELLETYRLHMGTSQTEYFEESPTNPQPATSSLEPVTPLRFETTPSHSFEPVREKNKICSGKTKAGRSCRAFARLDAELCIFHDPAYAEELRQSASFGGHRSVESRRARPAPIIPIDIRTPESRAHFFGYMISAILQGKVPHRQATSIARAMSMAMQDKDDFRFDISALART